MARTFDDLLGRWLGDVVIGGKRIAWLSLIRFSAAEARAYVFLPRAVPYPVSGVENKGHQKPYVTSEREAKCLSVKVERMLQSL